MKIEQVFSLHSFRTDFNIKHEEQSQQVYLL